FAWEAESREAEGQPMVVSLRLSLAVSTRENCLETLRKARGTVASRPQVSRSGGLRAKSAKDQATLARTQCSRDAARSGDACLRGPLTLTTTLPSERSRS